MRECPSLGSCGWRRSGGGGQSSCANTSVGGEGSLSHGAFPPEADSYIIMSTRAHLRFVSTALRRGRRLGSPLPEQKGRSLPPNCGNQQVGCGELLRGQRPPRNQTGWLPEEKDRTRVAASGGTKMCLVMQHEEGLPQRRQRGTSQRSSDQATVRAAGAVSRAPPKGHRDKCRE